MGFDRRMALYKFITRKNGPLLSSVQMCKGCSCTPEKGNRKSKRWGQACYTCINCQTANSLRMIRKNPSTQRRNEPESDQGTPLRTGILRLLDTLRNCCVVTFRNRLCKYSNFKISHTFNRYCKNKTTTSLTATDGISRHLIAGSKIIKFRILRTL